MLGFETGERWRNTVRTHRDDIARNFKISPESLCWYGAFHNESYHPHIHLIIYDRENKGFLNDEGIENLKSIFAHAIFTDEMLYLQKEKTVQRDRLRLKGKDEIESIVRRIHDDQENNLVLQALMIDLAERLKSHKGKKVYGYLNKIDKLLVKQIVDELEKIPAIKELYDLWYEQQEGIYRIYKSDVPTRIALSDNPDFKSIRNAVIKAAIELASGQKEFVTENTDPICVTRSVTGLLNNVSKIFSDKFKDNPDHMPKVDVKLKRKVMEKDRAHGLKHE